MAISIHDNGEKYIRITHITDYSVDVPKIGMIVQKNTKDGSFYIKQGSFIKFFKFADISYPTTTTIDLLINKLKSFITEDQFDLSLINSSDLVYEFSVQNDLNDRQLSSYIDFDTSGDTNIHSESNVYNLDDTDWDPISKRVKMTITDSNMMVCRQTKEYIRIPFGNTRAGLITARMVDNTSISGIASKVGFFDNNHYFTENVVGVDDSTNPPTDIYGRTGSGIYIGYDSDGGTDQMYIGIRSLSATSSNQNEDIMIPQTDWNVDPMDGSGVSQITIEPDVMYTWAFVFGNIHGASMKVGIYENGKLNIFHDIISNDIDFDSTLPIRMEIEGTPSFSGTENVNFEHKNATVYSVHNQIEKPIALSYSSRSPTGVYVSDTHDFVLASLKLDPKHIKGKIRVTGIEISCKDSSPISYDWYLVINPHWPGGCSDNYYEYLPSTVTGTHSIAKFGNTNFNQLDKDVDTADPTFINPLVTVNRTQDYVVASGSSSSSVNKSFISAPFLLSDMHGTPDVLRIVVNNLLVSTHLEYSLYWEEYS